MCVMAPVASRKMECLAPFLLVVNFPFNTAMQCKYAIKAMQCVRSLPSLPFPSKGVVFVAFSSRFRRVLSSRTSYRIVEVSRHLSFLPCKNCGWSLAGFDVCTRIGELGGWSSPDGSLRRLIDDSKRSIGVDCRRGRVVDFIDVRFVD